METVRHASHDGKLGARTRFDASSADAMAVHLQAERILAHPLFRYSKRYSDLLTYIVDRSLTGNDEYLRERRIGTEVFGRDSDYDPSLDPTVRVVTTEVRKRLSLYYHEAGRERELRIEIPARSYAAEFTLPLPETLGERPAPGTVKALLPPPETGPAAGKRRIGYGLTLLLAAVAAMGLWSIRRLASPPTPIHAFWAPLVTDSGSDMICLGSSPSRDPSLDTGSPGFIQPGMAFYLFRSRSGGEVSMTDVTAASDLTSFLEKDGKSAVVRPAHETSLADLKSHSAILIGYSNEWASRLGFKTRFQFRSQSEHGLRWIEDSSNPSKTWSMNPSAPYEQVTVDYSLVTRALDPMTGRWWVGVAGLSGLGTQAAVGMMIDPAAMATMTASLPRGWERKNLQFVLATRLIDGSPGASQVVAAQSW